MQPELTVVTIGASSAADCRHVLDSLRRQTWREKIELVVVAPSSAGLIPEDEAAFASCRWIGPPPCGTFGQSMRAAMEVSQAPYVTYAEEHAHFDEAWAEHVMLAHQRGYPVVGFPMLNANPQTLTSWAHLYGQFGPVVAPVESGLRPFLAGHHVSYQRQLLDSYAQQLASMWEDEGALFLDLRSRGIPLYLEGQALSYHVNISDLPSYLILDFIGQRSFAHARARVGNWGLARRLFCALAMPLVPALRMARILRDLVRTGRHRQLLPQILVPITLALIFGACGEAMGYLLGPGNAARQKRVFEFQRDKVLAASDPWAQKSRQ